MASHQISPLSLREQAALRAGNAHRNASLMSDGDDDDSFDDNVYTTFPRYGAPREHAFSSTPIPQNGDAAIPGNNNNLVESARMEWQQHGWTKSQALEDLRRQGCVFVRLLDAVERFDASGDSFTSYMIEVRQAQQYHTTEHRYSDFYKLHLLLKQNNINVPYRFPAKQWWKGNDDKIQDRLVQLDAWLVHVVVEKWRSMCAACYHAVQDFLFAPPPRPCDQNRDVQKAAPHPFSRTLGSALRQAIKTLNLLTSASDQSIPLDLLQSAQGILFMTIFKAGVVVSGQYGTGLVIARLENGYQWSAPCAVSMAGMGWGAQLGGDVTHCLVLFSKAQAVHDLVAGSQAVQVGASAGVALGPSGRQAKSSVQLQLNPHVAQAYAHARGLFVGLSLEGSWLTVRDGVNARFYGQTCHPGDLLQQAGPIAADPLYQALDRAIQMPIANDAFRPSEMLVNKQQARAANSWKNSPTT